MIPGATLYTYTLPIAIIFLLLIIGIKKRKDLRNFIKKVYFKYKLNKYGHFVSMADKFHNVFKKLRHHKQRPDNIISLLNMYESKIYKILIQLNKIAIIKQRVEDIGTEVNSESYIYIKTVYDKLLYRVENEMSNLCELYAICERKNIDLILLKTNKYHYDAQIEALIKGMNEIDKIYSSDLLLEHIINTDNIFSETK